MEKKYHAEITSLFQEYADYLFNYAITRVNDQETAEDLVQETFISALKNYGSFQNKSKASTWLTAILKNKIIDLYRKKVREYRQESLDDLTRFEDFFDEKGHWKKDALPSDWKVSTDRLVEQKEFYDILQLCLTRLSELQRIAFVMKHMDDARTEEICKELDITASNYWVIVHRAKLQLRQCIEKHWINA
ncbi:MAG: sigma-70 family RNA polymerase sigma factor [Bacteroidales bacterium]|nr:sigma-70 family RNA polymerase sigma factor [Bacteroidales bacterium]